MIKLKIWKTVLTVEPKMKMTESKALAQGSFFLFLFQNFF